MKGVLCWQPLAATSMGRRRVVLIAEDSETDAEVAIRVFGEPPQWEVLWAEDGATALDVLHRRGKCRLASVPDLLLLSIQMPKLRGPESSEGDPGAL